MKRHPSKRLIMALLLSKENVEETLEKFELPAATKKYLESLEKELKEKVPATFKIDKDDSDSVNLSKELGIFNLLFPDKFTYEAYSLIGTIHMRADLEKFILSKEDPAKISKLLTSKYKTPITKEAVDRYTYYFWNVNEMRIEDWELVLEDKKDKRQSISILKTGPDYARYVLGFAQKCQIKQALEEIANIMHNDIKVLKNAPESSDKAKTLSMYSQSLIKIDEKINSTGTTVQEDIAVFERVRITHTKMDIRPMEEMASLGSYTKQGDILNQLEGAKDIVEIE